MKEKLAKIVLIENIQTHPHHENLSVCQVLDRKVVTQTGDFKPGDFAVYLGIGSFLPLRYDPGFLKEFFHEKDGELEGLRSKKLDISGQTSEGILLPISVLEGEEEMKIGYSDQPWGKQLQVGPYDDAILIQEDEDVTEFLKVAL